MKIIKSKIAAILTATFLMLSMSASMMLVPTTSAHTPAWQIPTYAYIQAMPNTVGVGQQVDIFFWLTNYYYGVSVYNGLNFHNFKLTIIAPNGAITTETFADINPTSAQDFLYIPNQVGTYNLTFTYPGETYPTPGLTSLVTGGNVNYINDTFMSSSASTTLTVQQEPLPAATTSEPFPTNYWTRPIYGLNTNWYTISSNWLGLGAPNYGGWTNMVQAQSFELNGMAVFPGDAIGSQTSHVMWTKPMQSGGIVGGNVYDIPAQNFFDGSAYLIRYVNPIVLGGLLFYTEPISFSNTGYGPTNPSGPTDCVDLRTGELIWSRSDVLPLLMGYMPDVQTPNEHGVCQPILITSQTIGSTTAGFPTVIGNTTWIGYDGDTGNKIFNVTNVPAYGLQGSLGPGKAMGPDGEYLNYVFANAGNATNPDWRLGEWNSSLVFMAYSQGRPTFQNLTYVGANPTPYIVDGSISTGANRRYDFNISVPWLNTMPPSTPPLTPLQTNPVANNTYPYATFYARANTPVTIVGAKYGDGILCYNGTMPCNGENLGFPYVSSAPYTYFFVNLNASKGAIGSVLWWSTLNSPANNYTVVPQGVDWDTRIFLTTNKESVQWVGYNLDNGQYLWTGPSEVPLNYYGSPSQGVIAGQVAYGHVYSGSIGGIIYCYDDKTGKILWTYGNGGEGNSTNSNFNWPYGNIPTCVAAVGNDVVYLWTTEHTWTTPIYKGGLARAINATTGQEIWTLSSVTMNFGETSYAMADGYNTWFNGYDNAIYVVGRGPSATTVTAGPKFSTIGNSVVIEGTVTDISAGTKQDQQVADFPNGIPVASDASMSQWMSYVYQQQSMPTDFTGVPVQFYVLDSNGNYRQIGSATTDESGSYSLTWAPDIPGNFTVYANFAGTNGYWPSSAETHFYVGGSAATAPTATAITGIATSSDVMYIGIAIIVVIIIIGVLLAVLMMRKRP